MTNTIKYKGIYKDNSGSVDINIENDFRNFSLEIDGVKFNGYEFSSLEILDKNNYSETQVARFTLWKVPIIGTTEQLTVDFLCNCSFEIIIPQLIIDQQTNTLFSSDLKIDYSLGKENPKPRGGLDFEKLTISLTIEGVTKKSTSSDFESSFDYFYKKFGERYKFKNCYGCAFSDYSVYGQSTFGTMLCFVEQKDAYLKVKTKIDYLKLRI